MNRTSPGVEDSVLISLSVLSPDDISHPERRIVLTESCPTLDIGRSSNRPSLGLQPAVNNGWFDSPVMSRHHAKMSADIRNKTITIRDANSMHGTYLNDHKMSSEKPLRADDELILGVPVFRNQKTFQPVTVKLDRVEFRTASQPTTSPNRVFTVPDDCSTDDNENELVDESMDDPLPSSSIGPTIIDLEEDHWPRAACQFRPSPIPQVDGVVDLVSESGDVESTHESLPDLDQESLLLEDDEMDSLDGTSVDSLDLSNAPHDTNHVAGSPSLSWTRFSSRSADDLTDEDAENDSSLPEEEEDSFYGTDSDELGDTRSSNMERLSEPPEEPQDPPLLVLPPQSTATAATPRDQQLPPLISVIPSAQWVSPARLEPFSNVPVPLAVAEAGVYNGIPPRLPSPSDAVLPHTSSRRLDTGDRYARSDLQESPRRTEMRLNRAPSEHISAATLGQKSGKPDFFEAREQNKLAIARVTEQDSWVLPAHHDNCPEHESPAPLPYYDPHGQKANEGDMEGNYALNMTPDAFHPVVRTNLTANEAGHKAESAADQESDYDPASLFLQRKDTESREARAEIHTSAAASWSYYDPCSFEPASAYELQQLKRRSTVRDEQPSGSCLVADTTRKNHENLQSGDGRLDEKSCTLKGPHATTAQKDDKGKRKAAEISEVSEPEIAWARDNLFEAVDEDQSSPVPFAPAEIASPLPPSSPCPTRIQSPLPSPPTTPEQVANQDARPAKRMKKIAERVGYAALGGATVGAMVLTSLIYTAPSFV